MTRTGFDMDPFVVVSLGKKTYRTRHIRHNLNPVYDEKMIFQVLRHEQNYFINFSVIDRDKLSGNDFVGEVSLPLQDIIATAPSPNPSTGLYNMPTPSREDLSNLGGGNGNGSGSKSRFRLPLSRSASGTSLSKKSRQSTNESSLPTLATVGQQLQADPNAAVQPNPSKMMPVTETAGMGLEPFDLPIDLKNKERWEDKHKPELHIKAKYVPYTALRQQFWRVMLRQYDADDNDKLSRVELTTMLDSLGSTLTAKSIDGFFKRYLQEGESLDTKEITIDEAVVCLEEKLNATSKTTLGTIAAHLPKITLGNDDSSSSTGSEKATESADSIDKVDGIDVPKQGAAGEEGANVEHDELSDPDEKSEEHVIQISECPLCHQPRLNKRSEIDIVTHLATCASQDWRSVDRLVMGGFVTASQAQRKWYSKVS